MTNNRSIGFGEPVLGRPELDRIAEVFESGWILNGPAVERFEGEFRQYVGAENAVSVTNCTVGMELAFQALGLEGATVIVPGQAFVANAIALLKNDIEPLFVDVSPETNNIDPTGLEELASDADGVFVLHYAGHAAEMDRIVDIADDNDLAVVEDAAHSLGSEFDGTRVGTFGDATVFSFGPLKMITTAMGGMVTTPHQDVASEIESLRSYGMDRDARRRDTEQFSWRYSVPSLGHNYRLSDVAAAMGLAQLDRLPDFIDHRRSRAAEYTSALTGIDGIAPPVEDGRHFHTYLYYVIRVTEEFPLTRNELAVRLENRGVEVSVHWDPPLHEHRLIRQRGYGASLPVSEAQAETLLTLPMHPELTSDDVEYVTDIIEDHA